MFYLVLRLNIWNSFPRCSFYVFFSTVAVPSRGGGVGGYSPLPPNR